ncbi:hypothetical protein CAEBREN_19042 [Caenorhabditis brenneri]|uniref:CUB-like domain-containing protein n=1 Tax=Caenorhabditis brenneri TaxID=135651 RepID=G0MRU0_CAEBE|nr:hypothetical protein CAEBREN_19042 [Caenorhabditis brenneri]
MASKMVINLALTMLLTADLVNAVDFTCPTKIITPVLLGGNLPAGATDLTVYPKGTNCTFQFDIPNGYALLVQLSADFQFVNDTISTIDTTNTVRVINHSGKINNTPIWFAATSAQIRVVGVSGNSKFFATYRYTFLNDYTQVTKFTGQYFPLSQLSSKTYYTFVSKAGDKVVATYGKRRSTGVDDELDKIFVYDGADISTSKMVGTLNDYGDSNLMTSSSSSSLTLVNFYGSRSTSYVIGNDASALSNYFRYSLIVAISESQVNGTMGDLTGLVSGYTFICTDCSNYYLTQLTFDGKTFFDQGYAKFRGQTPTHRLQQLISYEPSSDTSFQMPQIIPTGVFTLDLHRSKLNILVNTGSDDSDWKRPYEGRKGYIFSPSLWNPDVNPNSFSYEFRNDSQVFNYAVNFTNMDFGSKSDQMLFQIGSGPDAVNEVYRQDRTVYGKTASNGNFMKVELIGSANDDVRMLFEINRQKASAAISFLLTMVLTIVFIL